MAVSAIIEKQHVHAGAQQHAAEFEAVADVASVAMTDQDCKMRARRIGRNRKKPSTQADSVDSRENQILPGPAEICSRSIPIPRRPIRATVFKPAKHGFQFLRAGGLFTAP